MMTRACSMFLGILASWFTAVAAASAVPLQVGPPEPENGTLGFQPPEVGDVVLGDTLLHQDTRGGVVQELLGVTGTRDGGFGLVWRDQRDASLGVYWVRLDAQGVAREPERPVTSSIGTSRRFDPTIALAPDGAGALAWITRTQDGQRPWMRCFDAAGAFHGDDLLVADPKGPAGARGAGAAARGGARETAGAAPRSPVLLARRDGSRTLAWLEGGRVRLADFDALGAPLRPAIEVGPAGTEPEVGLHALEGPDGRIALLWTGKTSAWFLLHGGGVPPIPAIELGAGRARGLALDAVGGFVALLERDETALMHRVGADGAPAVSDSVADTSVASIPGLRNVAIAATRDGFALLATISDAPRAPARDRGRDAGARGNAAAPARTAEANGADAARLEMLLLDPDFAIREAGIAITTPLARDVDDAFLASNGARLLVAWTDTRLGEGDVFGRIVDGARDAAERLGPERRLNSDVASADQVAPDVDALLGRGLSAWQDRRDGPSVIYARRFGAQGLVGADFALPIGDPSARPAGGATNAKVALRPDGNALVVWLQRDGDVGRLLGQIVGADGSARSATIEIDARAPGSPAVSRLAGERGWLVVWDGGPALGIQGRRVAPDGSLPRPALRLDEDRDDSDECDVTLLDDGRLVVGWTVHRRDAAPAEGWSVRARFLDGDGAPQGSELAFEPSRRGQDHDPAFAPAANGGFLMAWTSGSRQDPTRDVNARLFDAEGRAVGPNLTPCYLANEQDFADVTRLADQSFAVAWEDDVSYYDQGYVRRIAPDGMSMGAWMRIGVLETRFVPDRVAPRICALGAGWAAVFSDRQRSQGFDARIKIVGPRFDAPAGD